MPDVFLSYKREDRQIAGKLIACLRHAKLDVWWDDDIPPGAPWEAAIERALVEAKVVLVCWSKASVASENVRSEARWGRERGRLIQVLVGACTPPLFFGERQGLDLSGWSGSPSDPGFKTLVASLKAGLDSGAPLHEPSFAVAPPIRQPSARLARWPMVWLAGLAVVGVAGALAWFAAPRLRAARQGAVEGHANLRVAAPRFDVLDDHDVALRNFAGGLQAEMVDQLSQNRIDVALADPNGKAGGNGVGVGYAFGGTVERTGGEISVRIQLIDARQHVTVWSGTFHRPERAASVLQDEIAAEAAQVASRAVGFDSQAKGDTQTMGLAIKGDLYALHNRDEDREAEWENQKLLLAKLPNLSFSHSNLAVVSLFLSAISTPERAAELRGLAAREGNNALKLDPHDALAHFARFLSYPLVGHWQEREGVLLAGLKVDPQAGVLTNHESNFLREVGRLNDAVRWAREAAAAATPSANRNSTLVLALGAAGQSGEASALDDQDTRAWPAHPAVWSARLQTLIHQRRWTEALGLFRADAYRPIALSDDEVRAWTGALGAMASGKPAAKRNAARLLAAIPAKPSSASMPPHENYSPSLRIAMLAVLGDDDDAFTQSASYLKKDSYADSSFLFWPGLANFRGDKRFFPFVSEIGLADYWRRTGAWPDFCAEPGLPYDCRAEVEKLTPHTGP